MEYVVVAYILPGTLGIILIGLIITYFYIKQKINEEKCKNEYEITNEALLGEARDDEDDFQPLKPYKNVQSSINYDQYDDFTDAQYNDRYISEDDILDTADVDDTFGDLSLPAAKNKAKDKIKIKNNPETNTYSKTGTDFNTSVDAAVENDSQLNDSKVTASPKMKNDTFVGGCKLTMSLLFSKADMFLMLNIMEVSGIPTKEMGGFKFIRVATALLPEKKFHSTTKFQQVMGGGTEEVIPFVESFKFPSVTRESIFGSAFRFRLYGRNNITQEICIGEIYMQLADLARRPEIVLTRTFERKRKQASSVSYFCLRPVGVDAESVE